MQRFVMRKGGDMERLDQFGHREAMWARQEHAWVADPEQVMRALTEEGFEEYKREVAKDGRTHASSGGMWQGLDPRTGAVATVIWVARPTPREAHVFIDIDGQAIEASTGH